MPANRINATVTVEQSERVKAALATLAEELPFLIDLTMADQATMARFGDRSRGFVTKALIVAEAHPEILPRSFNLEEFRTDVDLVESLYPLRNAVETLFGRIDDTYHAAGSEAYAAALLVYQYAKLHHLATGALDDSLDDLGRRFARKSRKPVATD